MRTTTEKQKALQVSRLLLWFSSEQGEEEDRKSGGDKRVSRGEEIKIASSFLHLVSSANSTSINVEEPKGQK